MYLRQKAKEIRDIQWIAPVDLEYQVLGRTYRKRWKVDFGFVFVKTGLPGWAEAKGVETGDYKNKKELWRQGAGPGPLEIFKGTHKRPQLVETVYPKGNENEVL